MLQYQANYYRHLIRVYRSYAKNIGYYFVSGWALLSLAVYDCDLYFRVVRYGLPVFIQERVGKHQRPFKLIKFRTMSLSTESVATHLAKRSSVTKLGAFLRKTKLDELPQLVNVLKGEMSLVGPRPCLFNQQELIAARQARGV
ncbi:sugar transferase [Mangrovibacter sp. SLW1]